MDISKIIDPDDTRTTRKPPAIIPPKQEHRHLRSDPLGSSSLRTPTYEDSYELRHPQPSPLQTSGYHDSRTQTFSAHSSAQSPYHQTHSSSYTGGCFPSPQRYQLSPNGHRSLQREERSSSGAGNYHTFDQSTPIAHTPTGSTPGSASMYSNWQRPTSSHSIPTPNSAQHPSQSFFRGSPQTSNSQMKAWPQSQSVPQYSSQPSTPLGPPLSRSRPSQDMFQPSPGSIIHHRSLSGGYHNHQQGPAPSSMSGDSPSGYVPIQAQFNTRQEPVFRERDRSSSISPRTRIPTLPSNARHDMTTENGSSPRSKVAGLGWKSRDDVVANMDFSDQRKPPPRHSNSVGINDLLNAVPFAGDTKTTSDPSQIHKTKNSLQRESSDSEMPVIRPMLDKKPPNVEVRHNSLEIDRKASLGRSTLSPTSNEPSASHPTPPITEPNQRSSLHYKTSTTPTSDLQTFPLLPLIPTVEMPSAVKDMASTSNAHSDDKLTPTFQDLDRENPPQHETQSFHRFDEAKSPMTEQARSLEPAKKRARLEEKLTTKASEDAAKAGNGLPSGLQEASAQPAKRKKTPRMPMPIYAQSIFDFPKEQSGGNRNPSQPIRQPSANPVTPTSTSIQPPAQQQLNGHAQVNGASMPIAQPSLANGLGPWEPSILNTIPYEELTRVISDFLFTEVVLRSDIGVGPAGGAAGQGAVIEIEAKIGRLIDKSTMDRLRLPVMTECVISQADPNLRISFESSMTEAQHRALNGYLNKALIATQPAKATPQNPTPPPNPRIQMNYKHTRETDTFYELSQSALLALPKAITNHFNPRQANKTKVRITHDQKTGQELAKIVKARIADIDVYSPRTLFDWRISVNVEMDFHGDVRDLVELDRREGKKADRNKDRMSYKHLAYQVDLTQVTPADATNKTEKEHELEIEVSSAEVRTQGLRAQRGEPHGYEELIRGFVDNVRVLARHCQ